MPRTLPRFLSPLEVAEMFRVTTDLRDCMLLKCLYYLGLRNSEAQHLQIEDIDVINRTVKVVQGKGKKDRYVPIPGSFGDELRAFIQGRSGPLFAGRAEGLLSDRHIRRLVKEAAVRAGVRKAQEIHPHTMRHSYATHLQNAGVPLNVIQNILGHARLETTTIYTHLGIERTKEWVEKAFADKTIEK
ncbi:MAG: tyrosine-type recombinase/integrase [Candidatus Aenigmarchaeota archaeon]|nr:tyrosine-type recombinase/integrase [Candidatus Aenigmarchaeota archaeon]